MKDFLREVNYYANRVKMRPEEYNLEGPFSSVEVDRVMVRRFSKVARITLGRGKHGKVSIYLKKSIPNRYLGESEAEIRERVESEYAETCNIYDDLKGFSGIFTPLPLAIFPEPIVYLIGECPGTPLSLHIDKSCMLWHGGEKRARLREKLFDIGRALRIFHDRSRVQDLPDLDWLEMESYWSVRLEKIVATNSLFKESLADKIMGFLKSSQKSVTRSDLKQTMSHCDFNPGNILISESGISLLDFARTAPWSPFLDVTHLYHQLQGITYKLQFSKGALASIMDGFLEGYHSLKLKNEIMFHLFMVQNRLCQLVYLSRLEEHSFKSRLYNRYVIYKGIDWLERLCGE